MMNDNPRDFDNDCEEHCDACNSRQMGTEHYMNDAMGMATPVLWTCHRCENPPVLVGLWRSLKVKVRLKYGRVKYLLTTTAEERAKREAHRQSVKDRINARRDAEGKKRVGESEEEFELRVHSATSASVMGLTKNW